VGSQGMTRYQPVIVLAAPNSEFTRSQELFVGVG
jgi:hypothetical protein